MGLFDTIINLISKNSDSKEVVSRTENQEEISKNKYNTKIITDFENLIKLNNIYISNKTKEKIKNLHKRANEPMKLAVTGLFSSGKSTFLNAMLSDDILPSGLNPITSKITYLRYAQIPQLKITYNDGREEMAALESIEKYVSQQSSEQIKNIDYITLYYPKNILRKIVFVDTPGFNSPNKMDDETTNNILENVDGILWLTMISNAGKKSEIEILEKYFKRYNQKSICVVNHKDEIDDDDEVEEFIEELKEDSNFSKYFSDIVPISALQALESRQKDKRQELFKEISKFVNNIEKKLIESIDEKDKTNETMYYFAESVDSFLKKIDSIKNQDMSKNDQLYIESNIQKVFDYIEKEIVPQANSSLSFSIKKEIKEISKNISAHYQYLIKAIDELEIILKEFDSYQKVAIEELYGLTNRHCNIILRHIEEIASIVSYIIHNSFRLIKDAEFQSTGDTTFWGGEPIGEWIEVYRYEFDSEYIWNQLIDKNGTYVLASERLDKSLEKLSDSLAAKTEEIFLNLKNSIEKWKNRYSKIEEFSPENIELQKIALESFDRFVNDFENQLISFNALFYIYSDFFSSYYNNFTNIINASFRTAFYFDKSTSQPNKTDIENFFKESAINYEYIKDILIGKKSVYIDALDVLKKELSKISEEKTHFIRPIKDDWNTKNKILSKYIKKI